MGNKQSGAGPLDDYDSSQDGVHGPLFVVNFVSCSDVPSGILSQTAEFLLSENKIYLRSCIARNIGSKQSPYFERISNIVTTPSKSYTSTAIWNSYRDFTINAEGIGNSKNNRFGDISSSSSSSSSNSSNSNSNNSNSSSLNTNISIDSLNSSRDNNSNKDTMSSPPSVSGNEILSKANPTSSSNTTTTTTSTEAINFDNCYLSVEVVSKVGFEELGDVIGSVNIAIRKLTDESVKTFPLRHHKIGNKERFPKFTITLRRMLVDRELPPAIRTIFLLRHGESKWNKAQASRDIKGMLDFDHSLTLEGVAQAAYLNEKWKRESDRLKQEYEASGSPTNDIASFADRRSSISPSFINGGGGANVINPNTGIGRSSSSSSNNSNSSNVLPILSEDSKSIGNSKNSPDLLNLEESESYFDLPAAAVAQNSLNLLDNPSSTAAAATTTNNIIFPSASVADLLESDSGTSGGRAESSPKLLSIHSSNNIDIFNIEDAHHLEEDDDYDYEDEEEEGVDTTSLEYSEFQDRHQSVLQDNNTSSPIVNNLLDFLDDKNDSVIIGGETKNKDNEDNKDSVNSINNNSYSNNCFSSSNSSSNNNIDLLDLDFAPSGSSTSSSTITNFTPVESLFVAHDAVQVKKVVTVSAVAVSNPSGKTVLISAVHEGPSSNSNASNKVYNSSSSNKASNGDGDIGEFRDATMMNTRDLYIDSAHEKDDLVMQFRRDEFIRKFLSVKNVYCSPLTRALETAVVGLEGHPALALNGISLYSVIREIKGIGGVDTVGKAYGDKIIQRLIQELTEKVGQVRMRQLLKTNSAFNAVKENMMSVNSSGVATTSFENMTSAEANLLESNRNYRVHQSSLILKLNDANYSWWTPASSFDNEQDTKDRIKDFLYFCRYSDESTGDLIFVGHSLFFKHLYSHRISKMLRKNRPELASMMKKHRLANGSVLALTLYFPNKDFRSNVSNSSSNSNGSSSNSSGNSSSNRNVASSRADSVNTNISIDTLNSSKDNNTIKDSTLSLSLSQRAHLKEADLDPISPDPKTSSTTAGSSSKPHANISGQFDRGEAIIVDADLLFGGDFAEVRRARPSSVKFISSRKSNSVRIGKPDSNNTSNSNSKPAATEHQSSSNNNAKSQNTASTLTENFMSGIGSLTKKIHGWM